jgi:membrane-associated phospholipid phosphatase
MTNNQIDQEVSEKRGWDYALAHFISNVLNPPLVAAGGIFLMAAFVREEHAWLWALIFVLIVVAIPTLYVVWLLKRGEIDSFHIPNREKRHKPYIVIIASNILGVIVLILGKAPFLLIAFGLIGIVQSALLFLINRYWKISGHTTAISGLSVFLVAAVGWEVAYILIAIPLVAWARIRTKSHSFSQTVAGVLTGTAFILTTWYLIRVTCESGVLFCG